MSTKNKKVAEEASKVTRIKFLKNPIALSLSYLPGDVCELDCEKAELLIQMGFAEIATEEVATDAPATENATDEQPE